MWNLWTSGNIWKSYHRYVMSRFYRSWCIWLNPFCLCVLLFAMWSWRIWNFVASFDSVVVGLVWPPQTASFRICLCRCSWFYCDALLCFVVCTRCMTCCKVCMPQAQITSAVLVLRPLDVTFTLSRCFLWLFFIFSWTCNINDIDLVDSGTSSIEQTSVA